MIGGRTCPDAEDTASTPAAKDLLKPVLIISGIVIEPVV